MNIGAQIFAVVVTYRPDRSVFIDLVEGLLSQVFKVVVVDNSPALDDRVFEILLGSGISFDDVLIVRLGGNYGVATAINVGIDVSRQEEADYVILSDQDSQPDNSMVARLLKSYKNLSESGERVGAVGPTIRDKYTGVTLPFQVVVPGKLFYNHGVPTMSNPHLESFSLITSGTLISIPVLDDVGLMRDDLFIDYVDAEWCLRARHKGYHLFGVNGAWLHQRMGDASLRIWRGHWCLVNRYPPLRVYYRIRNFVVLCGLDYVGLGWKFKAGLYSFAILYAHCIFGKNRLASLRMACVGVWHALIKRMGRYDP